MRLAQALELLKSHPIEIGTETVPLPAAAGRVLAEDVVSPHDFPPWPISAMDGIAVRFSEKETFNLVGQVNAGDEGGISLKPGEGARINTGAVVPEYTDAIIKIEDIEWLDEKTVKPSVKVQHGTNIIQKGENAKKGTLTMQKGQIISSAELSTLRSFGIFSIRVFRKPVVGILNTGDELQDAPPLRRGKIIESNSIMLTDLIRKSHAYPIHFGSVKDEEREIIESLNMLLNKTEILTIVGGTSMGTRDLIPNILDQIGKRVFKGLDISPGKPIGAWRVGDKMVFSLPGYPVACYLTFRYIVRPYILESIGVRQLDRIPSQIRVKLAEEIKSKKGRLQFVRVRIDNGEWGLQAHSIAKYGASNIMSLTMADAILIVPEETTTLERGSEVTVDLIRQPHI